MSVPHRIGSELRLLDPREIRLERAPFGTLRLSVGIDERHEPVRVVRCFPLTRPDGFLSFQDEEGEEIGIVENPNQLPREAQALLAEELELTYLHARVKRILRVNPRQGLVSWELDTTMGPRTVYIRDRQDIRPLPDGRIVLTDIHGAKYEIPSMEELDDRSRAWLEIEM